MATTHRRVRSTRLLVLGLLVASLVTITLDSRGGREGPLAAIGRGLGAVIGPLQEGMAAVVRPVGSFVTNVFRSGTLADENAALREQIATLQRQASEVNSLRRENEELHRLLGERSPRRQRRARRAPGRAGGAPALPPDRRGHRGAAGGDRGDLGVHRGGRPGGAVPPVDPGRRGGQRGAA